MNTRQLHSGLRLIGCGCATTGKLFKEMKRTTRIISLTEPRPLPWRTESLPKQGWDTGEYSWGEFACSADHLGDGWRKPRDFGHRRRALCILRALAARLAASKAWRQSAARAGGRSRWQCRKFDGTAFAFSC